MWLSAFQKDQYHKFLQRGLPTTQEEQWKYTDVFSHKELILNAPNATNARIDSACHPHEDGDDTVKHIFINGKSAHNVTPSQLPPGVIFLPLRVALQRHEALVKALLLKEFDVMTQPFAVLNAAEFQEGIFLFVPKNVKIKDPIHLLFLSCSSHQVKNSYRNVIIAEDGSEVTLLEEYRAISATQYFTNSLTYIHAGSGAKVYYHKIQEEDDSALHIANLYFEQEQQSVVSHFHLTQGGKWSRENVYVNANEKETTATLKGLYSLKGEHQQAEHYVSINHLAAQGKSDVCYKGILKTKSRGIFNSKVKVHQGADGTEARQKNQNILLSNQAEVYTKPELEIYADAVKCSHGATVGAINQEALFFLRSRGIKENVALEMLLHAFAEDIFSTMKHAYLKQYIWQRVGFYVEL